MQSLKPLKPLKWAVIVTLGAGVMLSLVGIMGLAQAPVPAPAPAPPSKYQPTELQHLRLEVKVKDAQLAIQVVRQANAQAQAAFAAVDQAATDVKHENKWPETLKFDPDTLTFVEPPAAPVPAPAPAPATHEPVRKP